MLEVRVVGYNVRFWIENYGYLRDYDSREPSVGGHIGGDKCDYGCTLFSCVVLAVDIVGHVIRLSKVTHLIHFSTLFL
jgi:hypothetical protein